MEEEGEEQTTKRTRLSHGVNLTEIDSFYIVMGIVSFETVEIFGNFDSDLFSKMGV